MALSSEATVMRSTGSWYEVLADDGRILPCRVRGRLRLRGSRTTNPVAVGDRVVYEIDEKGECTIVDVLPRSNYIIRRASNLSKESHIIAANIDRAVLLATLFQPVTSYEFIDRFLVTAEAYGVPTCIVLGKYDLARERPEELEAFLSVYRGAGYRVIPVSAVDGTGIAQMKELFAEGTTLLAGHSGVGKSTLVASVEPGLTLRTGEVSKASHKGQHTTTFSQMYLLSGGGRLIDTPGIKGFGLLEIAPQELCRYFPDMARVAPDCAFTNCTHTHEPSCAVIEAVEQGRIAWQRYESYLKMLDDDGKYRR